MNIINENTIKPAPKKRKDIYNINEIIYDYDHLISDDEDDYVEDSPTEKKQKMAASDDEWLPSGVENMNQSCDESESQSDSEDFWDDLNYKLHVSVSTTMLILYETYNIIELVCFFLVGQVE